MKSYGGHFTADGGTYNLVIPFRPDMLKLWNYTDFGVDGGVGVATWFRDMPAGDAMTMVRMDNDGGGDRTSLALETTNGFTDNVNKDLDGTGFTAYTSGGVLTYLGPTIPIVDTSSGFTERHFAISAATAAQPVVVTTAAHGLTTGDVIRVSIEGVAGMVELNGNLYQGTVTSSTTISLQTIENPAQWHIALGSAVYGSDSDVIYFEAYAFDTYVDLGDIA